MPMRSGPGHSVKLGLSLYADAVKRAERRGLNVGQYVERAVRAGMALDDKQWRLERFDADHRAAERDNARFMPDPTAYGLPPDYGIPAYVPDAPRPLRPFRPR